ncbi:hypothetical protein R5W23_004985 [Gemmata sp. JC673]|uniref:Uncharacterized protein n=1 Tax=Gemmata algarum TaxID=2975278 RepID=A0ABU5ET02_9BACT|nr:hypothetical protein [Gemmata algarum]MDY3558290.1 hypothetical protein [Gemmata algarum]
MNRLAFIDICKFDSDHYRAGILVTDRFTDPIEFRCSSPVRPTALQKILWGRRLTAHLFCHVFGKPLIECLNPRPDLVLARVSQLLGIRAVTGAPTVLVSPKPELEHRLLPSSPAHYLCASREHTEDLDLAMPVMSPLAAILAPLEPFQRVFTAIQDVHQDETRAKAV